MTFSEVRRRCMVNVKGDGSGCFAHVGYSGQQQTVNLADGCRRRRCATCATTGIAEHEILHMLGMWHEQSRPDRDNSVTIHWDNIESGKSHNFDKKNDVGTAGRNAVARHAGGESCDEWEDTCE